MNCGLGKFLAVVLTATLLCVLGYFHLSYFHGNLHSIPAFLDRYTNASTQLQMQPTKLCLIYDKAPRTGSSTISNSLRKCWMSHKYKYPTISSADYSQTVSKMLNLSSNRVAITGVHFSMPNSEVLRLQRECAHFFYVTSTRPMVERIASKAKYEISNGRTSINTTLSQYELQKALEKATMDNSSEARLEKYPFPEQKMKPHYVIRSEYFTEDLQLLLRSFQCSEEIFSKNLHSVEDQGLSKQGNATTAGKSDENILRIDLKFRDDRHLTLTKLAEEQNNYSLQNLKVFLY